MKRILLIVLSAIVLIAVFLGLLILRPSSIESKDAVKAKLQYPESKFMQWRGSEIHHVEEGNGMPLVMIHGFGGSHRNFSNFSVLMKEHFRVIRIDLPGFGLSDFPQLKEGEGMVNLYRDFMAHFIQELQLDSFYLIGNSMGGGIAWLTAHDHPEKVVKLMLCASAGYEMEKIAASATPFIQNPISRGIMQKGVPMFISENVANRCWFDHSKINPKSIAETNLMWNREGNIEAALKLGTAKQFPDSSWIKSIQCPTLIVWGKQDEIIPYNHAMRFNRDIPGSNVVIFDSCGHLPMQEKPTELKKIYLEFING